MQPYTSPQYYPSTYQQTQLSGLQYPRYDSCNFDMPEAVLHNLRTAYFENVVLGQCSEINRLSMCVIDLQNRVLRLTEQLKKSQEEIEGMKKSINHLESRNLERKDSRRIPNKKDRTKNNYSTGARDRERASNSAIRVNSMWKSFENIMKNCGSSNNQALFHRDRAIDH